MIPGESLGDSGDREEIEKEAESRKQSRVTVRLTPRQFERLVAAADLNGVAPTTMARMLINRGARSILDEEQRAWRLTGDRGW